MSERVCDYCRRFFARYRCNKPDECDCPKCQGYCECAAPIVGTDDTKAQAAARKDWQTQEEIDALTAPTDKPAPEPRPVSYSMNVGNPGGPRPDASASVLTRAIGNAAHWQAEAERLAGELAEAKDMAVQLISREIELKAELARARQDATERGNRMSHEITDLCAQIETLWDLLEELTLRGNGPGGYEFHAPLGWPDRRDALLARK